ncbi:xylose isomerase (plasmid) [Rhodococcus erythropolis R138]|uniref:sugar phosphate isomerase/epimerase family protein n=1 Tax=Rhodococcus erythropolis TaxID=1833 RepID=UPI0006917204|nr:TIM barrel protein [Rhodococcus erythropolis]ALU73427.1 xylose isomerase [Rhodococcus erythropolis R138]
MTRPIGLAHLSALQLPPPDLVDAAASAGFSSIGARVHPATASETRYPMSAGSPMMKQTLDRLHATGLTVFDVEVFTLDGLRGRSEWLPVLDAGAALGARVLNVIGSDENTHRLTNTLGDLVRDAHEVGIVASIEPISYQQIDTFHAAVSLAAETDCGIMLDVLHFVRAGGSVSDLAAVPHGVVQVIQLCDGFAAVPHLEAPLRMPLGQDTNGSSRQIESRAKRQVPGAGEFPLSEILRQLPGVPVSVEVPDVVFVESHGIATHLTKLMEAAKGVVTAAEADRTDALQ